jgi:hypothetical protein
LDFLRHVAYKKGDKNLLWVYLEHLIDSKSELNDIESIALARECVSMGNLDMITLAMPDLLACVEEVGDLVSTLNLRLAASIYINGHIYDKAIDCFVDMGKFQAAHMLAHIFNYPLSFMEILRRAKTRNRQRAMEYAQELVRCHLQNRAEIELLFRDEPDFSG